MSAHAYPGAVINGRYRIEHVLGRGGMGVVLGATHLELGHRVALKVLKDEHATDAEVVERLLREARAVAQLKNDHVARVLDVGRMKNGTPFIVMEYLEGRDAGALLAMGPLPVADAVGIIAQACEALAEAHEAGIVHRDVKPANLFVTRKEAPRTSIPEISPALERVHVKVLDFGIARHTQATTKLTQTATVIGSPPYMAPEQMVAGEVDARTDVWSLAATLYEMLTGFVPFEGATMPEIYARIVAGPAIPPIARRPEIPQELSDLVLRCLSRDRDARPTDAAALANALAPFAPAEVAMSVAKLAPIAWGTTTRQPVVKPASNKLPLVAAGAGILAALAIAGVLIMWPHAKQPAAPPPREVATIPPAPPATTNDAVPVDSLPPLATTSIAKPVIQRPSIVVRPAPTPSTKPSVDPMSQRKW